MNNERRLNVRGRAQVRWCYGWVRRFVLRQSLHVVVDSKQDMY